MERPARPPRPTVMRTTTPVLLLLATGLLLGGCGDQRGSIDGQNSAFPPACLREPAGGPGLVVARADLDGDGTAEEVTYRPRTPKCGPSLSAVVGGRRTGAPLDDDLAVAPDRSFAISVPGRTGDIAVVFQVHPRGGFQAVLFGRSGSESSTYEVAGRPVVPFVSTDAEPTPLAARCVQGGIEVDQARRHEPVGIVPAWDVFRTTYSIDDNRVTTSASAEIADNVLEAGFRADYPDLVRHDLFGNCRVAG